MPHGRALPQSIETDRLLLRPWLDDDAVGLRALRAERDPRARHRIGADGRPTIEDLRIDLARQRADTGRTGLALLVVEPRGTPGFAGCCGLIVGQASEDEPELAYRLPRRWHGRGWATEAATALVAAADDAGWTRLRATVRAWNAPSRRVASKVGSTPSGRLDRDPARGDSIWFVRDAPRSIAAP